MIVFAILLPDAPHRRCAGREAPQLDYVGAVLCARPRPARLRRASHGRVGLDPAQDRRAVLGGLSPSIWLILGGFFVIWVFFRWQARRESHGEEPLVRRRCSVIGSSPAVSRCSSSSSSCRRGSSSSFRSTSRGARPVRDRHRDPPATLSVTLLAAVGSHVSCRPSPAPRGPCRTACASRRHGRAARRHSTRTQGPRSFSYRCSSSVSGSARSPRSSVRSPSRPCRTMRAGGRRPPEHDDEPRRLARHCARRLALDRDHDFGIPRECRTEPGDPARRHAASQGGARRRRAVHLRCRPRGRPRGKRPTRKQRTQRSSPTPTLGSTGFVRRCDSPCSRSWRCSSRRASRRDSPVWRRGRRTMCRWLAYSGSPIRLDGAPRQARPLTHRPEPHARQGATTTNGDGFGVGWYDEAETPRLYRSVHPAWNDRNLRELAAGISSHLFFAHIRASTGDAIQRRTRIRFATAAGCGCTTG